MNTKEALKRVLLRAQWQFHHPAVGAPLMLAAVHGHNLPIPKFWESPDIRGALALAGLPNELPVPKYPEAEVGVFKSKYVMRGDFREPVWDDPTTVCPVFAGTSEECTEWLDNRSDADDWYVQATGNYIDVGEESAWFAQFED